jgi:Tol biopolymer transport system component
MKYRFRSILVLIVLTISIMAIQDGKGAVVHEQVLEEYIYLPLVLKEFPLKVDQIAFLGGQGEKDYCYDIYLMNVDGSNLHNLTNTLDICERNLTWSPDGAWIAYNSNYGFNSGNRDIYLIGNNGRNMTRLTNDPGDDIIPAWSPQGDYIAFMSNRTGSYEIFIIKPDGSSISQITNNITKDALDPVWSPDGSKIGFEVEWQLFIMNNDGSQLENIIPGTISHGLKWSPNGLSILFRSLQENDGEYLFVMNLENRVVTQLTDSGIVNEATWSPDSNKIAYTNFAEAKTYVIDADGTNNTEFLCGGKHFLSYGLQWSPDGTRIVFGSPTGTCKTVPDELSCGIYAIKSNGNDCIQLTSLLSASPKWKPAD